MACGKTRLVGNSERAGMFIHAGSESVHMHNSGSGLAGVGDLYIYIYIPEPFLVIGRCSSAFPGSTSGVGGTEPTVKPKS